MPMCACPQRALVPSSSIVIDRAPCYRRGLSAALVAAGYDVDEPDDVALWAGAGPERGLRLGALATVGDESGTLNLEALVVLDVPVIALLKRPSTLAYKEALRLGAAAAVDWSAASEEVVEVFGQALCGRSALPVAVTQALVRASAGDGEPSVAETKWLRLLSEGMSVSQLAELAPYSEREMYRRLRDLYRRLGVSSRVQAINKVRFERYLD